MYCTPDSVMNIMATKTSNFGTPATYLLRLRTMYGSSTSRLSNTPAQPLKLAYTRACS